MSILAFSVIATISLCLMSALNLLQTKNIPNNKTIDAAAANLLAEKFAQIERCLGTGPYFAGPAFSLVDAAFGPVFRYFDVFERIGESGILFDKPRVAAWREALAARPSVQAAVGDDYATRLWRFLETRNSHLSRLMAQRSTS